MVSGEKGEPKSLLRVKRKRGVGEVMNAKSKAFKGGRKAIIAAEHYEFVPMDRATYLSIEAAPSTRPAKKYCDFTGLPAKYTDPQTKLRFSGPDAFATVRGMNEHRVQEFLALRGAQSLIK